MSAGMMIGTDLQRGWTGRHQQTPTRRRPVAPLQTYSAAQLRDLTDTATVAVLQAPENRQGSGGPTDMYSPQSRHFIDLRSAAASDVRERRLLHELDQLRISLASGATVEVAWPLDRDIAAATAVLGEPLALVVTRMAATTQGAVVIHTRTGAPGDFLTTPAIDQLSFVFHLNCEEAAMRWERADADPGRRLAAITRLRVAGWQVWACVGPVRLFTGWRDEYGDLAQRAGAAGVQRLLISFPGEDALELGDPEDTDALDVVESGNGYAFTVTAKHRREIYTYLQHCLAR